MRIKGKKTEWKGKRGFTLKHHHGCGICSSFSLSSTPSENNRKTKIIQLHLLSKCQLWIHLISILSSHKQKCYVFVCRQRYIILNHSRLIYMHIWSDGTDSLVCVWMCVRGGFLCVSILYLYNRHHHKMYVWNERIQKRTHKRQHTHPRPGG